MEWLSPTEGTHMNKVTGISTGCQRALKDASDRDAWPHDRSSAG
jgi:hypothetical protein